MKSLFSTLLFLFIFTANAQLYSVPVYAVTSDQPAQSGNEVSKIIDGNLNTMYHSRWYQDGIPDALHFYFNTNVISVKKLKYTPRQDGNTNGIWTKITVSYSTANDPNNFIVVDENVTWDLNQDVKELVFSSLILNPHEIKIDVLAGSGNFSSGAEMEFFSEDEITPTSSYNCNITTDDLITNNANDIKINIIANGSSASSFQSGENINGSFDNNINTLYHSSWSNTPFPVELIYHFDGNSAMDFVKYTPRQDGGNNGNFGEVTISYNTTANSQFQTLTNYNFDFSGTPTIVYFPNEITPLNIKFTVHTGENNFVSCAEMEFFKEGVNNANDYNFSNLFSDFLLTELKPNIQQNDIDTISNSFYRDLAQCIFDDNHQTTERVKSYQVYRPISKVSQELKIGTYDPFENAAGIVYSTGEKVVLMVQNLPSTASVQLVIKDFADSFDGTVSYYPLKERLNVFEAQNDGLTYIDYFNNDESLSDVSIHFINGKVNGVFDVINSTNSEWMSYLTNNEYPYLDLVGKYVHLVYEKTALKSGSPIDGITLLAKYDTIVQHERNLMGLFKFNRNPKNRQLTYSDHGGGWYAGGLGVHLDLDWGEENMVNPNMLDVWGIPHEYGHINQIRPAINWIGTMEVTNNIYSVWVDYQMNNENLNYTRLEKEDIAPNNGMQSVTGGRMNGALYNTTVQKKALQETDDVFEVLVPFWQLEIYYQLAGAAKGEPELTLNGNTEFNGVDYARWFGTVAEKARTTNSNGLSNGEHLLNFVKNTCDAVQEDLTDFFINSGFLRPIDRQIDDYGIGQLTITQTQIDQTIQEIQSKGYNAPASPVINYISAFSKDMYKNQAILSGQTGEGVNLVNDYLMIDHQEWKNAVAYETYNGNNEIIFVSISGTNDRSNQTTSVYCPNEAKAVYAVGFDGSRILVYPKSLSTNRIDDNFELKLYPNPVDKNKVLHLEANDKSQKFQSRIIDKSGKLILEHEGTINNIEKNINQNLEHITSGNYILLMINNQGVSKSFSFIID